MLVGDFALAFGLVLVVEFVQFNLRQRQVFAVGILLEVGLQVFTGAAGFDFVPERGLGVGQRVGYRHWYVGGAEKVEVAAQVADHAGALFMPDAFCPVIDPVFDPLQRRPNLDSGGLDRLGKLPRKQAIGDGFARYAVQRFLVSPGTHYDNLARNGFRRQQASGQPANGAASSFWKRIVPAGIDHQKGKPGIFESVLKVHQ